MFRKRIKFFYCFFCCFIFCLTGLQAQGINTNQKTVITGTVRDNLDAILSGATVKNLSTGKTILTNGSGAFSIEATKGDSLSASYIGYDSYTWSFKNQLNYDISLNAQAGSLNDVVISGFGQKQKLISVVGSQTTVDARELQHPVANMSTMLAGRVAGLIGVQRSGLPGSNSADIWIRGIQTFGSNPSGPLIIIDGVQGRSLDNYDPEDIKSFTILKDASATAVYGSLGANGVILITTKRGSSGKSKIMAQYLQGITQFTKTPELANAGEYMNLKNEAELASGYAPSYSQDYIDSTLSPTANHYVYPNVNWLDQVFNKNSFNKKLNVSATGGSENTQYYVSLDYYDESSMIKQDPSQSLYNPNTRYQRYNFTSNVDMKWTKTTKFSLSISGYTSNFNQPGVGGIGGAGATAAFSNSLSASPVRVPANYPGDLVAGVAEGATPSPNPYALVTQTGYDNIYQSQISSTAQLSQDLDFWVKGLSANVQYSFDTHNQNENNRSRTRSLYYLNQAQPYNADGSLNLTEVLSGSDNLNFAINNSGNRQNTLQGIINYDRTFGNSHVSGLLVYNQLSSLNPFDGNYLTNIPSHQQNYAAKASYSYKNKYFFEFNLGYNGSEDYAPTKRYGLFPAPGVAWVLSNENFFKPLSKIFQYFKIRYSDGLAGAPGTGIRFGYLTLVTNGAKGATFGQAGSTTGYSGVNISQYGANVQWAVAHTRDLGLDFNTVNNHLQFVLDYFHSHRTKVFLTRADFPDYAGLQYNPVGNYGVVDAAGFEGQITLKPLQIGRKMTLGGYGTFTYNQNKLMQDDEPRYSDPYQDRKGQSILAGYGYVAEGLFQSQSEIDNSADQSAVGNPRPGDIKYKDLNGDGVINQYDQTKITNGDVPRWEFGAAINFTYSDFYISAFFQGNMGAQRELSGVAQSPFNASDDGNLFAIANDRWTPENPLSHPFYPRLGYGQNANLNNSVPSTWWVKDISFIRFKTLDVGYNIRNKKWLNAAALSNVQIYFDAINLCYWSPFKLWDPELNTGDGDTYPNTRNLSIGIRINFK
ncbi:TonB-dependent receptor [Arachidicoccus soli]|uniref:TonB-dependent receptor n=2 Tax=Arachidicoccus soli TaxID=2341117 RepID=A0A386HV72_9BACT|nr:TonB-dependent receptor [Arachidicoccus soli]